MPTWLIIVLVVLAAARGRRRHRRAPRSLARPRPAFERAPRAGQPRPRGRRAPRTAAGTASTLEAAARRVYAAERGARARRARRSSRSSTGPAPTRTRRSSASAGGRAPRRSAAATASGCCESLDARPRGASARARAPVLDRLDDREHLARGRRVTCSALDVLRRAILPSREHRARAASRPGPASSPSSTSTIGKWRILPVWRSVAASNSSSSVPKPPGKTTNALA